jgi:hypothetical protein
MQRVLLTLGDSWPEGKELKKELGQVPYGVLLKNQLGFDQLYNYGSPGASNEDMLFQLQDYLKHRWNKTDHTVAVFHLTNPARTTYFPRFASLDVNLKEREHWPTDATRLIQDFALHFHTDHHELMRSSTTVTALQMWCQMHGIDDYYFSGWIKYPEWLPGVNTEKIWQAGKETAADWFGVGDSWITAKKSSYLFRKLLLGKTDNIYIHPNIAHPNQLGHQLIADKLATWISTKQ